MNNTNTNKESTMKKQITEVERLAIIYGLVMLAFGLMIGFVLGWIFS